MITITLLLGSGYGAQTNVNPIVNTHPLIILAHMYVMPYNKHLADMNNLISKDSDHFLSCFTALP
jgi:hypothetical protein